MAIKLVECLDWTAADRPGELARYAKGFLDDGVELEALWAYDARTSGSKLAGIGRDPAKLRRSLAKLGVRPHSSRCFLISGAERMQPCVRALQMLAEAGINVRCADVLAVNGRFAATVWLSESDVERAKSLLEAEERVAYSAFGGNGRA